MAGSRQPELDCWHRPAECINRLHCALGRGTLNEAVTAFVDIDEHLSNEMDVLHTQQPISAAL
jgi:hypothetical protein